jgi:hypothetical protein
LYLLDLSCFFNLSPQQLLCKQLLCRGLLRTPKKIGWTCRTPIIEAVAFLWTLFIYLAVAGPKESSTQIK